MNFPVAAYKTDLNKGVNFLIEEEHHSAHEPFIRIKTDKNKDNLYILIKGPEKFIKENPIKWFEYIFNEHNRWAEELNPVLKQTHEFRPDYFRKRLLG